MHQDEAEQLGTEAKMTTVAISTELRLFARTRWPLENDKSRKRLLASALKFTHRRVRSFYEAEETAVPRDHEVVAIEKLIGRPISRNERELADAQAEYRSLAEIASSLWALAHGPDADFYGPKMDALRSALLGEGHPDRGRGRGTGAGDQGRTDAA